MTHRRGRLRRPLCRRAAVRPLRRRLALAAGADRRDLALHDLGRGRLCGDGRDRVQPHRDRQGHPGRLLRERSRHGAGARPGVRQLQSVACPVRRRDRRGALAAGEIRALAARRTRRAGQRTADQVRRAGPAVPRRAGEHRRQRGGAARLSGRHGAGADLPQGPRAVQPDADRRLHDPHAVLFPQGRIARRGPCGRGRRRASSWRSWRSRWPPSSSASCRSPACSASCRGGHVHDADDVDRADLRQHLGAVRLDQPHHRPAAIHHPGHGGDRQRRGADPDRAALVPAGLSCDRTRARDTQRAADPGKHEAAPRRNTEFPANRC